VQVEGIALDEDSLTYLGEIGEETSLRHAVQVGAPLAVRCR
jgi:RuvB-like protein 1 (pontin 52)